MKRFLLLYALILFSRCEKEPKTLFSKLSSTQTNIKFSNLLKETHTFNYFTNPYIYLGGGVGVGDINNDGLEDLYFTGNMVENKLYLNKGNLEFEDITENAGVQGDDRWYSGIVMADVNQDGFLDIYCSVGAIDGTNENVLYINNQDNTFTEKAKEFGIADTGISKQSVFLDFDKDGDLDLFVANYPPTSFTAPVDYYAYMQEHHASEDSDKLYRNDKGKFTDITQESGIDNFGLSLGVISSDFNNDSYPDLYISNDFNAPDYMYINNQDGTFSNTLNATFQQTSFFGMGVDAADYNNDGWVDLFQLDMSAADNFRSKANMSSMDPEAFYQSVALGLNHQYMQNSLQLNNGISNKKLPVFSNISRLAGVSSTDWSWGGLFADFDNDGWKDLFVTNGIRRDVNNKDFYNKHRDFFNKMENDPSYKNKEEEVKLLDYLKKMPSEKIANYMYKNNQDLSFQDVGDDWGFGEKTFSNGVAYSDLDNDGDLDLILNNLENKATIYRNNSKDANFLIIRLEDEKNKPLIGSKVTIQTSDITQMQELNVARGYMSSVSPRLHFGLGKQKNVKKITVEWPNGKVSLLDSIKGNQEIVITSKSAQIKQKVVPKKERKIFETVLDQTPYKHQENPFDDFEEELLLPHKNSAYGPSIATGDLNGDSKTDYIIGGAVGQPATLFIQKNDGSFEEIITAVFEKDKYHEDLGIAVFDADQDGDQDLYIVSGGNEFEFNSIGYTDRFYENKGNLRFERNKNALPASKISGMEVSYCDFDQDGDLDLFVGGRLHPKKYPYPASSRILENKSKKGKVLFEDITAQKLSALKNIGLVTDSEWIDFDKDGWEDLVIVGEWMEIRFFKNTKGNFKEVTHEILDYHSTGWWNSIQKGDFDNDGDLDLIVGNLGENYKYTASKEKPFKIYLNDFDQNQKQDIVLSYSTKDMEFPVRGRQCSSEQMPAIKNKFKDYNSFASASIEQIYTDKMLKESLTYEITSFQSIYLENTGKGFKVKPLPKQAQFSNINKILVQDFNNDQNLDALIAGNLYNAEVETPRNDSSFGLLLLGDGKGNFTAQSMADTGLMIQGEVRDLKPISVNDETYLLVGKNNAFLQKIRVN